MKSAYFAFLCKCLLISLLIVGMLMVAATAMETDGVEYEAIEAQQPVHERPLRTELLKYRAWQKFVREHGALMRAIENGDIDVLQRVLQSNSDVAGSLLACKNAQGVTAWDQVWESENGLVTFLEQWALLMSYSKSR